MIKTTLKKLIKRTSQKLRPVSMAGFRPSANQSILTALTTTGVGLNRITGPIMARNFSAEDGKKIQKNPFS